MRRSRVTPPGLARALAQGGRKLASNALLDNAAAHAARRALGFEETERVLFRRSLHGT